MIKLIQTPGSALILFLRAYQLNPTNLAKQLKLSQATVRLLTLDKTRISVSVALRLSKFFKMKPDYWLNLQNTYDLARAEADPKLKKLLKSIPVAKKPSAQAISQPKAKPAKKPGKTPVNRKRKTR